MGRGTIFIFKGQLHCSLKFVYRATNAKYIFDSKTFIDSSFESFFLSKLVNLVTQRLLIELRSLYSIIECV